MTEHDDRESDWPEDDQDIERSPICPTCGVSCLPPETPGEDAVCENPDCDAFGEPVG